MLAPAGVQAAHIGRLWDVFLVTCSIVFAAILIALGVALWRSPRAGEGTPPDVSSVDRHEPGPYRSVVVATLLSVVGLLALLVASVWTDRALAHLPIDDAVHIEVTGHQWWWSVTYAGKPESETFTTANELHVPVGRPVVVKLTSNDVIHTLWVPNLSGKKDLIPGRETVLQFRADTPGVYRGQCAEFCGFQHAFMAFEVVADPPEQFAAWAARQRQEAGTPTDPLLVRGQQVFLGTTCIMCHAIQGTNAHARSGPDLTHVGGRRTLASGTLANTPEDLFRWIKDPQKIKPGANMPASTLPDADLRALAAYLESLK
ncbi:cytochrome c oxidase subunit II [Schlegelella sp. ID0723]|uniref:Cytochrome aa3 subunit 2 n=2 Tax=Piscinibacter koreensis TaxID=2742824 RepID=A0A7Y6NP75_9BURK|nr:cytochrome c oxidase subunit II [Schlegelella koreensis]NUZ06759.1 cytochrome c oxidase subunit II [Schlegelella koreensis]